MASEAIKKTPKTKNRFNNKFNQTGYWEENDIVVDFQNGEETELMKAMGYYSNGLKKGIWKWYDYNNVLRIKMQFKKDIPYGITNVYNNESKLIEEVLEIN